MSSIIVGRSELESRDPARHVASGVFRPGLGYELAQPVFALYESAVGDQGALGRYRRAREALRLELTDSAGARVSFRELHILTRPQEKSDRQEFVIEVESDDSLLWHTGPPS